MSYHYVGSELELFAAATNWKAYLAAILRPFVVGRVLEVGAGIGSNTSCLHSSLVREWTCLEPDANLARRIEDRLGTGQLPANCRVVTGTIASIDAAALFDRAQTASADAQADETLLGFRPKTVAVQIGQKAATLAIVRVRNRVTRFGAFARDLANSRHD